MLSLMALLACTSTPAATPWLGAWVYPVGALPEVSCGGRPAEEWGIGVDPWEGILVVKEGAELLEVTMELTSYICDLTHAIPDEGIDGAPLDPPGQDCTLVDDPGTLGITWSVATLTPLSDGGMHHQATGTLDVFGTACDISIDLELPEPWLPPDTGDTGDTASL